MFSTRAPLNMCYTGKIERIKQNQYDTSHTSFDFPKFNRTIFRCQAYSYGKIYTDAIFSDFTAPRYRNGLRLLS